jgi:hypothetical protein
MPGVGHLIGLLLSRMGLSCEGQMGLPTWVMRVSVMLVRSNRCHDAS